MKTYRASATIDAPPQRVWDILVHTAAYPEWDPFCDKIEGRPELGAKLKAFSKLSPGRGFPVRVTAFSPARRMTWTGGMPLGLFKGERNFCLEERGNAVEFTLEESFSGLLSPLIVKSIPDLTEAFEAFAKGLKQRAEVS